MENLSSVVYEPKTGRSIPVSDPNLVWLTAKSVADEKGVPVAYSIVGESTPPSIAMPNVDEITVSMSTEDWGHLYGMLGHMMRMGGMTKPDYEWFQRFCQSLGLSLPTANEQ